MSEDQSITLSPTKSKHSRAFHTCAQSLASTPKMSTNQMPHAGTDCQSPCQSELDIELLHSMHMEQLHDQGVDPNMLHLQSQSPPRGYPTGSHGAVQSEHPVEGNGSNPIQGQGMPLTHQPGCQDRSIIGNTLGVLTNAAGNVAGTVLNVAANRVLPDIVGPVGTDIITGTIKHYTSSKVPYATPHSKVGSASQASTPAFSPVHDLDGMNYQLETYKGQIQERERQVAAYQREVHDLRMANIKLRNDQSAAFQESMMLADKCEAATKLSHSLQATVQNQAGELQNMNQVINQLKAAIEAKTRDNSRKDFSLINTLNAC
jgi:hypothetical protein